MAAHDHRSHCTISGIPLAACYGADDIPPTARAAVASSPGAAPYLRGAYPAMYRERPWRIFQLSGFGNPADENQRIRFLLGQGEHGFIMEHDRNTADHLYDVDHPEVLARREDVGLTGAVIMGVRDYETVLDGIALDKTYGHPGGGVVQHAPFALSCYWTVARRRGIPFDQLSGTGQSDYFLTYLGCIPKQQVPTRAGLRLCSDIIEFCAEHLPRWVPVSIAGYNGADTGLNAWQELGATFANAIEFLDDVRARGRIPLEQAARGVGGVSFRVAMDFFEEIAKLRVARKLWSCLLRERYGITDERAARLRIHVVTAGSAMTYQQPLNNLVRGTLMGLAAVLGGVQSLGVSGYDEALSIPSEHAHQMSLRIQQVMQHEANLTAVADPLGGSYFIESLGAALEEKARGFIAEIEAQGGFLASLDSGWLHKRAEQNQLALFDDIESGARTVVGVNDFKHDQSPFAIDGFRGSSDAFEQASRRLAELRRTRHQRATDCALKALASTCRGDGNVMPAMMAAVDADATVGEIGAVFRDCFGDWHIPIAM
ncbi:MAG: acyl-CoA mutase large subunit family protein [Gammaproteobacteria bacterium]|nr:acyl-CoA mutase large subunit family protein [Gammaproteobacteria bacterium]